MNKKICSYCKQEFTPSHNYQKYCSVKCGALSRKILFDKKCLNCYKEFHPWSLSAKFCSRQCHYNYPIQPKPWNKDKTKLTDNRLKIVSKKVSKILKKKYANGEIINPEEFRKVLNKNHTNAVEQEILEYQRQGFRCITVDKVVPDFIAMKNGKVFAVEVEFGQPNYEKYNEVKFYDDITWIRYRRTNKL